jgi:hypothetical protein
MELCTPSQRNLVLQIFEGTSRKKSYVLLWKSLFRIVTEERLGDTTRVETPYVFLWRPADLQSLAHFSFMIFSILGLMLGLSSKLIITDYHLVCLRSWSLNDHFEVCKLC